MKRGVKYRLPKRFKPIQIGLDKNRRQRSALVVDQEVTDLLAVVCLANDKAAGF